MHTKYRRIMLPAFTPQRMNEMEPMVRRVVRGLLDEIGDAREVDASARFAVPMPMRVFCELAGLPVEDSEKLEDWIDRIFYVRTHDYADTEHAAAECCAYLAWHFEARRRERPRGDLLGWLLAVEIDGRPLSEQELVDYGFVLLTAGLDTTAWVIRSGLSHLAQHPQDRARLAAAPELAASRAERTARAISAAPRSATAAASSTTSIRSWTAAAYTSRVWRADADREVVSPRVVPRSPVRLYPLRFEPIYEYRLWGGRHLSDHLTLPLPSKGPIGEAWLLSDREEHQSIVADGPLQGWTIGELLNKAPEQMLGAQAGRFRRFPLLLKFLDACDNLSVQVHPSDRQTDYLPAGEPGKTEAWVVLESGVDGRVYPGLRPGTTLDDLRTALMTGAVAEHLVCVTPKPGDAFFIPAGTVHSLGGDVVVFEVQQNSDVTFRLYDWNRTDPKTGQPRPLQVGQALACIDFEASKAGVVAPVVESVTPVLRERLFLCEYFEVWRLQGGSPFTVGAPGTPRVLVCIEGDGELERGSDTYTVKKGDVLLVPAMIGTCAFRPRLGTILLEIAIPETRPVS